MILNSRVGVQKNTINSMMMIYILTEKLLHLLFRGLLGRVRMVLGFTTTCTISAYHH